MQPARAASVLAAVLIIGGSAATQGAAPASEVHMVVIENMRFNPSRLTLRVGERVVWVNKDLVPHTVTANGMAFASSSIEPNVAWSYVVPRPGEYTYRCAFHPTMQAMLRVIQ